MITSLYVKGTCITSENEKLGRIPKVGLNIKLKPKNPRHGDDSGTSYHPVLTKPALFFTGTWIYWDFFQERFIIKL